MLAQPSCRLAWFYSAFVAGFYSGVDINVLADDFIAGMVNTKAWMDLVADLGEPKARDVLKQRLAAQDANSLINWQPDGPSH